MSSAKKKKFVELTKKLYAAPAFMTHKVCFARAKEEDYVIEANKYSSPDFILDWNKSACSIRSRIQIGFGSIIEIFTQIILNTIQSQGRSHGETAKDIF